MAELKITIPDDKVQLVLEAFADIRGIDPTVEKVKKEITDEIKSVVKRYKLKLEAQSMEDVDVT